jgi:SAM-dependent methyltransferase
MGIFIMPLRRLIGKSVNRLLRPLDLALVSASKIEWLHDIPAGDEVQPPPLPTGATEFLRSDNPELAALKASYKMLADYPVSVASLWQEGFVSQIALTRFRSHNAYLWQQALTPLQRLMWILVGYYVAAHDRLGLLDKPEEDGQFGAHQFRYMNGRIGSKDLLDSVNEINFLDRHLGLSHISDLRVLDIGAGYGRLIHRLLTAFPGSVTGYLMDAIPESTFLARYYMSFRGLDDRATVIPLNEFANVLDAAPIDLVTNVHSFSECPMAAICWWLDLVDRVRARHLFVVPNAYHNFGTKLLSREADGGFLDFLPEIERRGFRLMASEPKYRDPALNPFGVNTIYYLFERKSSDQHA